MAFIQLTSVVDEDYLWFSTDAVAGVVQQSRGGRVGVLLVGDPEPYYVREDFDTVTQMIAEATDPTARPAEVIPNDEPFAWPTSMTRGA